MNRDGLPKPPRLATWLLERGVPTNERSELVGDLHEEFEQRVGRDTTGAARRWFWRQTVNLLCNRHRLIPGRGDADTAPRAGWLADAGADWRLAARALRKAPAFTTVSLLSLIVSLGLSTAVFSLVKTVILDPLPFATADRIVRLGIAGPSIFNGGNTQIVSVGGAPSPPQLADVMIGAWSETRQALEALASYGERLATVRVDEESLRLSVADVGVEFFSVLPVRPLAGRVLQRGDSASGAPRVAVVSARALLQRWSDPARAIGKFLMIDEVPHEVVGVLPVDFDWPDRAVDIWVADRFAWPKPGELRQMGRVASTLGLLRPGVTVDDARREGQGLADQLAAAGARLNPGFDVPPEVVVTRLKDELIQPVWPALVLLVAGTIGVLIAGNVNLAGFLVSRHSARRRDLAMRQALGATPWRLVRPVVFEQVILGAAGGIGALALASFVIEGLPMVAPHNLPRLALISLDATSLLFAAAASLVTSLVVGLWPARGLAASNLRVIVADGGAAAAGASRRSEQTRGLLVVCQLSVATLLLVGSALVGRSLLAMIQIDPGYRAEGVLTFQVGTSPTLRRDGRLKPFYDGLFDRLRLSPGVMSIGTSTALPLHGAASMMTYRIPGLTPPQPAGAPPLMSQREYVSTEYLQTIGATLVSGRMFSPEDTSGAQLVTIVNETFARTFMPGVEPLGQVAPIGVRRPVIVGVIRPIKRAASTMVDVPAMYQVAAQYIDGVSLNPTRGMGVAVRTAGDPMALAPIIRQIVRELDPSVPVHNMLPLEARLSESFAQPRFFAIALVMFAVLAMATVVLGVYGVLASAVERRRMELGVRRALGATTRDVVILVLGQAVRLAAIGVAIGALMAVGGATLGRATLYGVSTVDAASYGAALAAVMVVVLLGAWLPMRSALRVDPARVLKSQ